MKMKLIEAPSVRSWSSWSDEEHYRYLYPFSGFLIVKNLDFYVNGSRKTVYRLGYDYRRVPFFAKWFRFVKSYAKGSVVEYVKHYTGLPLFQHEWYRVNVMVQRYFRSIEEVSEFVESEEFKVMFSEYKTNKHNVHPVVNNQEN